MERERSSLSRDVPAPGLWLLLKLPVIGLVIALLFLVLGEFSSNEITMARSMLGLQTAPQQDPSEV